MHVEHNREAHRFYIEVPGGTAELAYQEMGEGILDLVSTYVPPAARGQGLAGRLVEAAMAHARAEGLRIIPSCWYVADWLRSHPEAADLLAEME